jgi:tetratricopeptide (TPR) repeat protein
MPAGISNEVSGTVNGPSVQAGTIRGDVHIHQPATQPALLPLPGQLPPPGPLTDRGAERRAMDAARASRVIVVTGPPGIGKTALAVSWAHGVRVGFPDGALLADLRGHAPGGPATAGEALGRFLRALGVDTRHVPADLDELTGLYRSVMAGRRMLVVLDDALSAAQVLPLLPSGPQSVAVVTSRRRLSSLAAHGAHIVQLDRLGAGAALELLSRTIGGDRARAEPGAARELAELCGRLPLALRVAGARLAARPRWPVSEMTAAMSAEQERLAALTTEDDMAVRSALDLSYSALPPSAARMYRLVGLFPGTWFGSGLAAAAAAVPLAEARRLLGMLADASLLDDDARDQYRFHDLTRLHAREMAGQDESAGARDEAVRRTLDWYLATAGGASLAVTPYRAQGDLLLSVRCPPAEPARFDSAAPALDWLDRELPNVLAAARQAVGAGQFTVAWQLADAMWPVFLFRGRHAERLQFDRLGLAAARAGGDAVGEAKMLYRLGTAVLDDGQHDQAEAYIRQALAAWQRLGRPDKVAGSLRRLGYVATARSLPGEAVTWFTRALAAYRQDGDDRHVAVTLSNLGDALTGAGRAQDAITALNEARALLADSPDPHSQARVLTRLGRAHDLAGHPETGAAHLHEALSIMQEIGSARGEADALTALGDIASHTGQQEEARTRYDQARRVVASLRSPQAARASEHLAQPGQP